MGLKERVTNLLVSPPAPSNANLLSSPYSGEMRNHVTVIDPSKPIGVKTTPETRRISLVELESAYLSEPNVFNAINKTTQLIMAAGYEFLGNEKSLKFFRDFFSSIGSRGGELEWEELLSSIFKHQMIFGTAWVELIPAKNDPGRVVDLQFIDPKKMDYAKDANDKIVLNNHGNSVGYVETLPYDYSIEGGQTGAPEMVSIQMNQVFFPPNRVAHFKLYTIGDGFYPVGLVEPSYHSINRKIHLEQAHANSIKRNGFPRLKVKYGDDNHPPTEEQLQRAMEKVANADNMGVFVFPPWVELELLEPKSFEGLQDHLNYYTEQIVAGTGLPKALVTGSGETASRSILNRQEALTKLTLKEVVRRTVRILERDIISPIADSNKVNPVKIVWGNISIEELDGKAKRLAFYTKNGLLTPDEKLEERIRVLEDLPKFQGIWQKRDKNVAPRSKPKEEA